MRQKDIETEKIRGWVLVGNIPQFYAQAKILGDQYKFVKMSEDKFPQDTVLNEENNRCCYLEGFVANKNEIIKKYHCEKWSDIAQELYFDPHILTDFRGGFCGFVLSENKVILFNDQMGNRVIYYYVSNGKIIASTKWHYVIKVLKDNCIKVHFDELAARYMLTYGYMLDETTFASEVKRVLPGQYIEINLETNKVETNRYFLIDNKHPLKVSLGDSVEKLDYYFRQAVRREFEKDREYGYSHLTDLSGGLDSRMTTWVAHEMGYTDQTNITYCQNDYLDFHIAQNVAAFLRHEFIFKSLDDFKWFADMDDIVKLNNGAALYSGISGGRRLLLALNTSVFGIEHTGMIGDAIISTFFTDINENYAKPMGGMLRYSDKLECSIPTKTLDQYENAEQFAVYTRGLMGAQTSYFIRQNYFEVSSPFLDVDFIKTMFKIPFQLRKENRLYLEWIKEKYPVAAKYGWERWGGVRPRKKEEWKKYLVYGYRIIEKICKQTVGLSNTVNMVPMDYYLQNDDQMQKYINEYFIEYINNSVIMPELRKDMKLLFSVGNALEKTQVLTVLAIVKNFFVEKIE